MICIGQVGEGLPFWCRRISQGVIPLLLPHMSSLQYPMQFELQCHSSHLSLYIPDNLNSRSTYFRLVGAGLAYSWSSRSILYFKHSHILCTGHRQWTSARVIEVFLLCEAGLAAAARVCLRHITSTPSELKPSPLFDPCACPRWHCNFLFGSLLAHLCASSVS